MTKQCAFKVRTLISAHLHCESSPCIDKQQGKTVQTGFATSPGEKGSLDASVPCLDDTMVERLVESLRAEVEDDKEKQRLLRLFVELSRLSKELTIRLADISGLNTTNSSIADELHAASAVPDRSREALESEVPSSSQRGVVVGSRGQNVPVWRLDAWKKPWQAKGWSNGFRPDGRPKRTAPSSRKTDLRDIIASMG
ncbi:hypothetical protein CERZMDRAFT_90914 [Cercospora zeae-maydis SCOH1-5]|uniref:Uncharacterized protein n=1 Tax=Cercospora zeae-maydis SCOH1-5 TaxID=717836 RepID=A0A6A6FDK7_9PEZI|nr:hypothetical protein CERZMDRAFT_90914 [Cercospora zeae-maydis SCOH1-5]